MDSIKKLIEHNLEKIEFINSYLLTNDMISDRLVDGNFTAVKELSEKKRALITSIYVVDDKIVKGLNKIKADLDVKDISEASTSDYPELAELKRESVKVLRLMVKVKESDEALFSQMDDVFDDYQKSEGKFDKKKLESYTKDFFE